MACSVMQQWPEMEMAMLRRRAALDVPRGNRHGGYEDNGDKADGECAVECLKAWVYEPRERAGHERPNRKP